jgi:hypothetical protein
MSASGFPGNRVDAHRAGITARIFFSPDIELTKLFLEGYLGI